MAVGGETKMRSRLGSAVLLMAALLLWPGVGWSQERFSQADLSGEWAIFLYGAYETRTEHMFGLLSLDQEGRVVGGSNTYRGIENQFMNGQLTLSQDGQVSGGLLLEAWRVEIKFIKGRINRSGTEITGLVEGQWYPGLIRMIKAPGAAEEEGS